MSLSRRRRVTGVLAAVLAGATGVVMTGGASQAASHSPLMNIQILSFNDFHGNLEPPTGSSGRVVTDHALDPITGAPVNVTTDAGGVEYLATHLRDARKGNPNTVTVAAGDIIGASPLLSAAFHDEPTIEAMNKLGLEATAVGNHEFDEGYQELLRMQNGGCLSDGAGLNNPSSCAAGPFTGAKFQFLAANVKHADSDTTILPPYWVKEMNGAKVGFIGMTLKETPSIVTAAGVAGLDFTDEVATANALVPVLEQQGVKAIIVLIHQGGTPAAVQQWKAHGKKFTVGATYDYTCGEGGMLDPSSPILPIAKGLSPQIDMVISGHTHNSYVCNVPDPAGNQRLVTSASSFGRLFTETKLTYDRRTNDIVRSSVKGSNMVVSRDVAKAADETSLINTYKTLIAPIANKELGTISADITRTPSPAGESALGDLIADAQVKDPSVVFGGKAPDVAFMNPGGIRADLTYAKTDPPETADGIVRYEEAFTVQPFNNYLVSMDLTGAQILALLQQQWSGPNATTAKMLQISDGLHYAWTQGANGRELVPDTATIGGQLLVETQTYRIVTNNFLSDGGDGFPAFTGGLNKYFGGLDIDGFAKYFAQSTASPYKPLPLVRITKQ